MLTGMADLVFDIITGGVMCAYSESLMTGLSQ